MILISILIFIVVIALSSFHRQVLNFNFILSLNIRFILYSGIMLLIILYIQSIGSGVSDYIYRSNLYDSLFTGFSFNLMSSMIFLKIKTKEVIDSVIKHLSGTELKKDLQMVKYEGKVDSAKVTLHAAPVAMNLLSYSIILRGYMKYVHNRPYPVHYSEAQLLKENRYRSRQLAFFCLFGAAMAILFIRGSALGLKNMVDIQLIHPENTDSSKTIFLLLSKALKNIPFWVKVSFNVLLLSILIIKLLGYNLIDILINDHFLKMYVLSYGLIMIIYSLMSLFILHQFATKKVNVPEVLPLFLKNWLEEFEVMAQSKIGIEGMKKDIYLNMMVYIISLVLVVLFL